MEKTTIPSVRAGSDITIGVRLKYSGVPIDWSGMSDVKALIYSDARKALSGRCLASVRTDDPTVLSCEYPARKQQYAGVNRIIIQAKYQGRTCSFDKPAFNVVPRTALLSAPEVVVIDPSAEEAVEVDVTIEITEVTTGLLDRAIAAALKAADEAEEAAHLVPLQVLEDCREATGAAAAAKDAANAAAVHAIPYIGENGHWWKWDSEAGAYVDTGEEAQGPTGNGIQSVVQTTESQESGGENIVTVTLTNGTTATFSIRNGAQGIQGIQGVPGVANVRYKQVDNLPTASAATMDFIYLVESQTAGIYNMSYTEEDGGSYTWRSLGTTAIQLADYATKSEVSQLSSKVPALVRIAGNGNTLAVLTTDQLAPGHTYRIELRSWDQTGVTASSSNDGFSVSSYNALEERTYLVRVYCGTTPEDSYEITVPANSAYMKITGRVSAGQEGILFIEDISLSVKAETDIYGSKYKYLEGFYLNSDGGKYSSSDSLISLDYIPVHTGQKITWHHGFDPVKAQASLIMYNSNHEKVGYYSSYVASERTIDVSLSSAAYIRASFSKTAIDAFVQINGKTVWKKQAKNKGLKGDINKLNVVEYDPATIELLGGKIDSEGTWLNTTNWSHVRIPAKKGDKFHLFGANESRYAFIRWNVAPYTGDKAILTPGTLLTLLPAGVVTTITIPEDCRYLYLEAGGNGNTNLKRLNLPDSIVKETALFNNVEDLRDGKSSIGAMVSFVGAGDSYNTSYASRITDVLPGGTYRIHFLSKPEVHTGSRGFARTRIWSLDALDVSTKLAEIGRSQELPDYLDVSLPLDAVDLLIGGRCAYGDVQEMMVEMLPSGSGGSGILDLNPDSEFIPKLLSVSKRYYTGSTTTKKKPLVIAHLSDIHGNWKNVERFLKFCDHHKQFVDLMVNTGDTVNNQYSQGIEGYSALEGVNNIINVVGNHDTYKGEDGISDVRYYVGLAAYNMLIAPFVSAWGVTQPDGAAENGYCYFFKDYVEKNIRLVFVDVIGYDEIQNTWLAAVLEDARSAGYHIAIFTHFNPARPYADRQAGLFEVIPCNFSTLYESGTSSSAQTSYNEHSYMMADAVHHFMANGGHFVGYFMGHYHKGFVARLVIYPDQLIYAVGASKAGEVSDYAHTLGTREQDEFYIIGIDPMNTLVKLLAVGANYDRYGRKKGSVCVDYSTGQVLGEGW